MSKLPFVVRVYGVYHHPEKGFLVSDEEINGMHITKFPGGGLEFGEGTRECLVREMFEEAGQEFRVLEHIYTTDFFVPSAFNEKLQVISIYYRMEPVGPVGFDVQEVSFLTDASTSVPQIFRWVPADRIGPEHFTLVIDRHVGSLLKLKAE